MLLSCQNVGIAFGVNTILDNVSFVLEEGEKAAVVGANGAGKTTLFKLLTGEYEKTSGVITLKKDATVGYLAQMTGLDPELTIEEELTSVFSHIISLENELRRTEREMSGLHGAELETMMARYSRMQHSFEDMSGYEYKSRVRGVIKGLNFSDEEAASKTSRFSGGQKTRIALGKLLLSKPELLLLDEPTNHLDIKSIEWLEDVFLKSYPGAVLVISHDRYFLDKTVTKVIEIENLKSTVYNGNYDYYAEKKELDREIQMKHYIDQQKEIARQEEFIKIQIVQASVKSFRRAQSRQKLLDKVERITAPENLPDRIRFVLEPRFQSGNEVLYAENLRKRFGNFTLFENINFDIRKSEAVALIGPNGVGKTTLFNMIINHLSNNGQDGFSGRLKLGTNVTVGYYDQEHSGLNEANTVFDEIKDAYPMLKYGHIRNVLASFAFTGDDVFKEISKLSGGEKGRVSLAKIMLGEANLLLLDEPTNHLDLQSKEILEEALRNYTGTVFYISHDRYFINNTADKIIEMSADGCTLYLGDYDYYVEKKAQNQDMPAIQDDDTSQTSNSKEEWMKKKNEQSDIRRLKSRLVRCERQIAENEQKIAGIDEILLLPEVYTDHVKSTDLLAEKTRLEDELLALYAELEEISD